MALFCVWERFRSPIKVSIFEDMYRSSSVRPKVNTIAWLEFELTYYVVVIQHVNPNFRIILYPLHPNQNKTNFPLFLNTYL